MSDGSVTLYIACSLDGFIATSDGGVEWLEEFQGEPEDESGGYEEFFDTVDCLLMGSKTYEQVLEFGWPYGQRPTYVITHRDLPQATDAVELFDGDLKTLPAELKQRFDHIWLVGGAQVVQALASNGDIDRMRFSVVPRILGDGIRLFAATGTGHDLNLVKSTEDSSGIVELEYTI